MKFRKCAIIFLAVIFFFSGCAVMEIEPVRESAIEIIKKTGGLIKEIGEPVGEASKQIVEEIGKRIEESATEEETVRRIEEIE